MSGRIIGVKTLLITALLGVFITLLGCENISFYSQAVTGQLTLLASRKPIDEVIEKPDTPDSVREKLKQIQAIRQFAQRELKLPLGDNYSSYVDLKRQYVVWNIFATPQLSLEPLTWCYPFVGCADYRGYFSKQQADTYAAALIEEKNDVQVGGVSAYSTLGFFDDPVLNTFLRRSEESLAGLIFHELAHQVLYVSGDTTFNESFANAVEQEGLKRWRLARGGVANTEDRSLTIKRRQDFIELVLRYRDQLAELFNNNALTDDEKLIEKKLIYQTLTLEYETGYKPRFNGYSGYDNWFNNNLNNAKLITISTYEDLVPQFLRLLETNDGDLEKFYQACIALTRQSESERRQILMDQ